nr:endonuclease V [Marinitoga lauensis]
MKIYNIHDFNNLTPKQCIEIQKNLIEKLELFPLKKTPKIVAGVDLSFLNDLGIAIIVVIDETFKLIDLVYHYQKIEFPYIPGLLAFRELPVFLEAWKKLNTKPDLVFFDGQGIAHPRKMGIATHGSFFINIPTIGIAKSRLYGTYDEPCIKKGCYSYLYGKNKEKIGVVLRTREKIKPVFVSPGNYVTIEESKEITLKFTSKYKIPEPTRLAHIYSQKIKMEISGDIMDTLQVMIKAAKDAGDILLTKKKKLKNVKTKKSSSDLVSEADIESQKLIVDTILNEISDAIILAEETWNGDKRILKHGKKVFVIDPLDGTLNYVHGMDFYSISIAMMDDGEVKYGVVYLPETNKLYYAKKIRVHI